MHNVSIIIPTALQRARASSLDRAIESVLTQRDVEVELIVVANGAGCDPELVQRFSHDDRLRLVRLEQASAPLACRYGRSLATADYFGFLDDDDELLPDALAIRCEAMMSGGEVDLVVTNGYRGEHGRLHLIDAAAVARDPLRAMLDQNWLASCGALFRTATCGDALFADLPRYLEWTMLAYRLLLAGKVVRVVEQPTYRINDTPESVSKSREYAFACADVIEQLLSMPLPRFQRRQLRARLLASWHGLSVMNLAVGDRAAAWKMHLQSLTGLSGLRYLPYTWRLVLNRP